MPSKLFAVRIEVDPGQRWIGVARETNKGSFSFDRRSKQTILVKPDTTTVFVAFVPHTRRAIHLVERADSKPR